MLRPLLASIAARLRRSPASRPVDAQPPANRDAPPDYEAMLQAFYSRLALEGATVIDVGAHVGRHAIPLARQVGMAGACYAFEPIPAIREELAHRIASSGLNNIVLLPFALADRTEAAQFEYAPSAPEESGLKRRHAYNVAGTTTQKIAVRVARLDDVLPAAAGVRFIKIDVEGGERDVLRGAARTLDRCRPIVAFECGANAFLGYHDAPDEVFDTFASRGYRVYSITGEPIANVRQFRDAAFRQQFWDYVAFPDGGSDLHALIGPG